MGGTSRAMMVCVVLVFCWKFVCDMCIFSMKNLWLFRLSKGKGYIYILHHIFGPIFIWILVLVSVFHTL